MFDRLARVSGHAVPWRKHEIEANPAVLSGNACAGSEGRADDWRGGRRRFRGFLSPANADHGCDGGEIACRDVDLATRGKLDRPFGNAAVAVEHDPVVACLKPQLDGIGGLLTQFDHQPAGVVAHVDATGQLAREHEPGGRGV